MEDKSELTLGQVGKQAFDEYHDKNLQPGNRTENYEDWEFAAGAIVEEHERRREASGEDTPI